MALSRFIAICLFAGYRWPGISGIIYLFNGVQVTGLLYDAVLHSVVVGYVFSMIFDHAPIIFPVLTRITLPFYREFYLPRILLHGSLILRIMGDITGWSVGRMWGGILNEVAILTFIGILVYAINHK